MDVSEQELLFRRWLADHAGLMWKVVRAFTATPEDAEDLFQEIALQLWMSLPAFRGEAKESTWIYRVAFNTALVWKRVEKRRRAKHEKFLELNGAPGVFAEHSTPTRDEELVQQLYTAIRQLPKLDASLALMHLDSLSYREMSEVLGITESNVGVKLNRLRKQLAEMLKGAGDEL
ncbi:MAG: RNA polymerase sigma factor [Verrucomicrobia bacterium]|nr:RNA polymerase sigma factor [Verrucomicrobiota bacterium]